ncbi:hypothetical protein ACHAXR_007996 [Thalassiosira sp. AJA248-18]
MSSSSIDDYAPPIHQDDDITTASTIDSLSFMMEKECTTYCCHDYLYHNASNESTKDNNTTKRISPDSRMKVVDWCYGIVDRCQLNRDTVAVAMNMADRFMSSQDYQQDILHHHGQYQLLIISALYLSIKIHESVSFSSSELAALTHDTYSKEDIEDMEMKIVNILEWRLCVPTAQTMGSQLLDLLEIQASGPQVVEEAEQVGQDTWDFLRDELAFQTQNSVRDYYFATKRYSTIAVAAILNAIEQVNDADYELLMKALICTLKQFDFDETSVLLEARHRLRCLVDEDYAEISRTKRRPLAGPSVEEEPYSCQMGTDVPPKRKDTAEETMASSFTTCTRSCTAVSSDKDNDSCLTVENH